MDHLPVVMITLNNATIYPLNTLDRKISFLSSIIFLSFIAYEFIRQYLEVQRLYKLNEEEMTPLDKGLSELYFDGLCEEELSESWYVRNYNLLFTLRLVVIVYFIVTMQYL